MIRSSPRVPTPPAPSPRLRALLFDPPPDECLALPHDLLNDNYHLGQPLSLQLAPPDSEEPAGTEPWRADWYLLDERDGTFWRWWLIGALLACTLLTSMRSCYYPQRPTHAFRCEASHIELLEVRSAADLVGATALGTSLRSSKAVCRWVDCLAAKISTSSRATVSVVVYNC